jgi:hypothetical protein
LIDCVACMKVIDRHDRLIWLIEGYDR